MTVSARFDTAVEGTTEPMLRLTFRRPDDWHVHLRDGAVLQAVLPFTAAQFKRGIAMPNLVPPVTTVAMAAAYRERILSARGDGGDFTPLMTCYLTDRSEPDAIERGFRHGVWRSEERRVGKRGVGG